MPIQSLSFGLLWKWPKHSGSYLQSSLIRKIKLFIACHPCARLRLFHCQDFEKLFSDFRVDYHKVKQFTELYPQTNGIKKIKKNTRLYHIDALNSRKHASRGVATINHAAVLRNCFLSWSTCAEKASCVYVHRKYMDDVLSPLLTVYSPLL